MLSSSSVTRSSPQSPGFFLHRRTESNAPTNGLEADQSTSNLGPLSYRIFLLGLIQRACNSLIWAWETHEPAMRPNIDIANYSPRNDFDFNLSKTYSLLLRFIIFMGGPKWITYFLRTNWGSHPRGPMMSKQASLDALG